jgi:hypothetical protein
MEVSMLNRWMWSAAAVMLLCAPSAHAAPPSAPPGTSSFDVNCATGQTVGDALARAARTSGPVVITISGVCTEQVVIRRDDVTLQGAVAGDGLTSSDRGATLVWIDGARRAKLHQLTLTATGRFSVGVEMSHGAQAVLSFLTLDGPELTGVAAFDGAVAEVYGCEFRNGWTQIQVTGGHLVFSASTLDNGLTGILVNRGGTLYGGELTIRGQQQAGIAVSDNGAADLAQDLQVTGNQVGVSVGSGGRLRLSGFSIAGNRSEGLVASDGANVFLAAGVVEGNVGHGVRMEGGSILSHLSQATIRNNGGSGISLADTSITRGGSSQAFITGNGGWGIFCAGPPAVAQVTPPGFSAANVTGNSAGASNCPALGIAGRVP